MPTKRRIINAINNLPSGDVKKLQGVNGYRLRVGDFRILFDRDGNITYIEKIDNRGQVYKRQEVFMTAIKERILGAVSIMSDSDAETVWNMIITTFPQKKWDNIETIAPDEWDLKMIEEAKRENDGESIGIEDLAKDLGITL